MFRRVIVLSFNLCEVRFRPKKSGGKTTCKPDCFVYSLCTFAKLPAAEADHTN